MKTRTLGYTGIGLSTLGLGTWAHGGGGWAYSWGATDDTESEATVGAALDAGVNWVDTAAAYGVGHCEEVLGRALKRLKRRPFVATKCALVWDEAQGRFVGGLKRAGVRAECEASLKRLGVETIDLYQIHWPNPDADIEEGWGAIAELIREGKVRFGGVSNFSVAQMRRCQAIHPIASLQPPYSMLCRGVESEILAYCADQRIGVVAYSPLQKGLLTGKVTPEYVAGLHPDDHRHRDPMFAPDAVRKLNALLERLRPIAARRGLTLAQLALAWVLRRPELTSAIVGARRPDQIVQAAPAASVILDARDQEEIEEILATQAPS